MEIIYIASVRMYQMGLRVTGLSAQAPLLSPPPLDEPQQKLLFYLLCCKILLYQPKNPRREFRARVQVSCCGRPDLSLQISTQL